MAHFDKFSSLDKTGWDKKKLTQTIRLGKNALIGLFDGVDLELRSSDEKVCVIHEEPAPSISGWRQLLLTPLQDGSCTITAQDPYGASKASMQVQVTGKTGLRMVFFPGERSIVNLDGNLVTLGTIYVIGLHGETLSAAAGPPGMPKGGLLVPGQGGHTAESTPSGHYILGKQEHVTTSGWPGSVVPWGAALKLDTEGDVIFSSRAHHWQKATGPHGLVTHALALMHKRNGDKEAETTVEAEALTFFYDTKGRLLSTYNNNDFGMWGWNLMQNKQRTAYFLHTTPGNEKHYLRSTLKNLENSHGCIHLVPKERDALMDAHVLKEGTPFEVRPYSESGPP